MTKPNPPKDGDGKLGTGRKEMKTPIKSLSNVIAACALLLFAVPSQGQNICDTLFNIAGLGTAGVTVEHKTDYTDPVSGCTTQMDVKIDMQDPSQTKLDFKIDRSCPGMGQVQFIGLALDLGGATACHLTYDNPADATVVNNATDISMVPQLQELFDDAVEATDAQGAGDPLGILDVLAGTPACPCFSSPPDAHFCFGSDFVCSDGACFLQGFGSNGVNRIRSQATLSGNDLCEETVTQPIIQIFQISDAEAQACLNLILEGPNCNP